MEEQQPDLTCTSETFPDSSNSIDTHHCPICLELCSLPVRLPCSHVFCFLCAKGVALNFGNCSLCRKEVDMTFFLDPDCIKLKEEIIPENESTVHWFYEGRSGWWQYDERTECLIDKAFKMQKDCTLLISGSLYVIDFQEMCQYCKDKPWQKRSIKRDVCTSSTAGVAGLRFQESKVKDNDTVTKRNKRKASQVDKKKTPPCKKR